MFLTAAEAEAYVDSLGRDYIEMKAKFHPHWATAMGIPGFDGKLARYTGQNVSRSLRRSFGIKRKLTSFGEDSLSISGWVDQQLLLAEIKTHEYWFAGQTTWRRSPLPYTDAIIEGIVSLLYRGKEDSLSEHLASRLADIPNVVADARENVTDPIKLHCELASAELRDFRVLIEPAVLRHHFSVDTTVVTFGLVIDASSSLRSLQAFIDSLAPLADPRFALGAEEYGSFLATRFYIDEPPEVLLEEASRALSQAKTRMSDLDRDSGDWDPPVIYFSIGGGPRNIVKFVPDHILSKYSESLRSTISGIGADGILTIIPADTVIRVDSPPSLEIFPVSMQYQRPGASGQPPACVHITKSMIWSAEYRPDKWHGWSAVRGSYPVQHLGEVRASGHASHIRRHLRDEIGRDGWILYAEGMMSELGTDYARSDSTKWEEIALAATSLTAEVRIHTGESTVDEAAYFIAREAGIDYGIALQDARRYAVAPGSGIGYLLGRREILRLRERYKKFKRNSFDLKEFHDTLLSCGYLPPYLLSIEVMSKGMGRE